MSRQRMFLDMSCVDAARERIKHIYDTFDTVCIQFSGGKDSTAVLYLAKELHEERGLGPVQVIFRDEEMVSPLVVDFIEKVRNFDWVDMEWYCLPVGQECWVLGKREYVLLWSEMRRLQGRLIRPMPSWAIHAGHFGMGADKPLPEPIDYYTMQGKKGRTAFITGVRANESMVRFRSVVNKLNENYITRPYKLQKSIPLMLAKPIYDWVAADVLKFIQEEHGAEWCEYYDVAAMVGGVQRVGIPLHSVAIRRLRDYTAAEPEWFDRLYDCFPQVDAQYRLWPEFDVDAYIADYAADGWDGVKRCIDENMLTPGIKRTAQAAVADFRKKHITDSVSYPISWLVRTLVMNEFHTTSARPVGPKTKDWKRKVAAEQEYLAAQDGE